MANVLLVSNTAWSFYKFRKNTIQQLLQAGHRVTLCAPYDEFADKLIEMGATFHAAKNLSSKGMNPFKDFLYFKELKAIYKQLKPDVIFQYTIKPNIYGSVAAGHAGIPAISIITGLGYTFIKDSVVTRLVRHLYKFSLNSSKEVWFLNNDDRDLFIDRRIVKRDKAVLLSCGEGIDVDGEFNPATVKPQNLNNTDRPHVHFMLICRLLFDKGVREYVEAARQVRQLNRQATFHIVGYLNVNNPSAISQAQMNEWLNENVIVYHGSTDDVRPFIRGADCVVLPSYREGMSTILMEGASLAKPIITTNIPGCKEIVEDNVTGFLCSVKDAKDLAAKITQFIDLPVLKREEMGAKGRAKMSHEFSANTAFKRYEQAIKASRG
jgi:glycosyltransferase involved in cell wall biosynthesis